MKSIHIQLSYKTVHFIMSKIFWKDYLLEFDYVFDCELCSVRRPVYNFNEVGNLTL